MSVYSIYDQVLDQLDVQITSAAVFNKLGLPWYTSLDFDPDTRTFNDIIAAFNMNTISYNKGIVFDERKFIITTHKKNVISAISGDSVIASAACNKCYLFGYSEKGRTEAEMIKLIEQFAQSINSIDPSIAE